MGLVLSGTLREMPITMCADERAVSLLCIQNDLGSKIRRIIAGEGLDVSGQGALCLLLDRHNFSQLRWTESHSRGPCVTEAKQFQQKLDETTLLLRELQEVQNERLSTKPPPNIICLLAPSARELQLGTSLPSVLFSSLGRPSALQ